MALVIPWEIYSLSANEGIHWHPLVIGSYLPSISFISSAYERLVVSPVNMIVPFVIYQHMHCTEIRTRPLG